MMSTKKGKKRLLFFVFCLVSSLCLGRGMVASFVSTVSQIVVNLTCIGLGTRLLTQCC